MARTALPGLCSLAMRCTAPATRPASPPLARSGRVLLSCAAVALLFLLPPARPLLAAGGPEDSSRRVHLDEAFPAWEQGLLGASALATGGLLLAGWLWGDELEPAIGPPGTDSLDRWLSERFAGGRDDPLLWGVPDAAATVYAVLPLALYGSSTLALAWREQGFVGRDDFNPHLRLMAYGEALTATLLVTQATKLAIGRTRPRNVLHGQPTTEDSESQLSFFSMHTSLSFTAASFLTLDLGRSFGPAGKLALGSALYGLAGIIGFSRIHDQAHFFSDVLVGMVVGVLSGNLFYLLHFEPNGTPRLAAPADGPLPAAHPAAQATSSPLLPAPIPARMLLDLAFSF